MLREFIDAPIVPERPKALQTVPFPPVQQDAILLAWFPHLLPSPSLLSLRVLERPKGIHGACELRTLLTSHKKTKTLTFVLEPHLDVPLVAIQQHRQAGNLFAIRVWVLHEGMVNYKHKNGEQ